MQPLLQKVFSFKAKTGSHLKKGRQKTRGQSLVEMAISLPVIFILFSGLVEFGFMLNYYLSLLDATRYAARQYADLDPFIVPHTDPPVDNMVFYYDPSMPNQAGAAGDVAYILTPINSNDNTRKVKPNPATDDVIVSVFMVNKVAGTIERRPTGYPSGYHLYGDHVTGNQAPAFTQASLESQLIPNAPCQGILVVEVAYTYHQVLGLPWLAWLGSPVLHAYSVFPLQAAEPSC